MYRPECLSQIPFFQGLENEKILENVLDSLTQVISRKFIVRYAQSLIDAKEPFALIIADIDNFKYINDNFGHSVGDEALVEFANSLTNYVGHDGLVGRFGGDEFLIVLRGDGSYEHIRNYLVQLADSQKVVRREYQLTDATCFLTCCFGSASFPLDADNLDGLFIRADKALYRGKSKGRNCSIVYVDKKHKDIKISEIHDEAQPHLYKNIARILDSDKALPIRAEEALDYIVKSLGASGAYFIDKNKYLLLSNADADIFTADFEDLHMHTILDENRLFYTNDLDYLKTKSQILYDLCIKNGIQSILLSDITMHGEHMGYTIITENNIKRIWQERDKSLVIYISTLLGYNILMESKKEA